MEEVEQICSRVAIMDKGKVIASGPSAELKSMIRTGEKITIELLDTAITDIVSTTDRISALPSILSATHNGTSIQARSEQNRHSLSAVIQLLNQNNVAYGRVFCELPTLNDVFLEMTGKHLRDQQGV